MDVALLALKFCGSRQQWSALSNSHQQWSVLKVLALKFFGNNRQQVCVGGEKLLSTVNVFGIDTSTVCVFGIDTSTSNLVFGKLINDG